MPLDHAVFGEGIYTPREAARLLGGTAQEIRRWTRGSGTTEPLWKAHYQYLGDAAELSFLDLIEIRVVRAMRQAGISLQAIRSAIDLAKTKFDVQRPLATQRFRLLGNEILMDALENDGQLLSLSRRHPGQKVFSEVVRQSLSDVEYEDGYVVRWRPAKTQFVVLDPARAFGAPIIDDFGISTKTLYEEHLGGMDQKSLAALYEIPVRTVQDAIRYETSLSNKAAA